jgi:hypothetical protein
LIFDALSSVAFNQPISMMSVAVGRSTSMRLTDGCRRTRIALASEQPSERPRVDDLDACIDAVLS